MKAICVDVLNYSYYHVELEEPLRIVNEEYFAAPNGPYHIAYIYPVSEEQYIGELLAKMKKEKMAYNKKEYGQIQEMSKRRLYGRVYQTR